MGDRRDIELRNAALEHVRELSRRYDDLVPVRALAEGFQFGGRRVSFGSFYRGIFRPKELDGPAALCLVTAPPKSGRPGAVRRRVSRRDGSIHLPLPRGEDADAGLELDELAALVDDDDEGRGNHGVPAGRDAAEVDQR